MLVMGFTVQILYCVIRMFCILVILGAINYGQFYVQKNNVQEQVGKVVSNKKWPSFFLCIPMNCKCTCKINTDENQEILK